MKNAILFNTDSGNACKINAQKINDVLFGGKADVLSFDDKTVATLGNAYDKIVVCGGDGTLSTAVNNYGERQMFYVPCGTLNEASKQNIITTVGTANDKRYVYVCACGSFCETGYTATTKNKQKLKAFAYLPEVLKNYKIHCICADVSSKNIKLSGNFTLLMFLRSKQCFGFRFNKNYNGKTTLVAVKTPKYKNLCGKIALFFPLFRIFFVGITKPTVRKNWCVLPIDSATVTLADKQNFCFDGEKVVLQGQVQIGEHCLKYPIKVQNAGQFRKKRKQKPTAS